MIPTDRSNCLSHRKESTDRCGHCKHVEVGARDVKAEAEVSVLLLSGVLGDYMILHVVEILGLREWRKSNQESPRSSTRKLLHVYEW